MPGRCPTYVDITQLKQREEELREARDQAQMADAAKSEFLANMSHELRTPLNAIMGFSQIIANQIFGAVEEKYLQYAGDINNSGAHLLSIINQLLDISKVEAGQFDLAEELIDITEWIDASQRLVRHQASLAGVDVAATVAADLPKLCGDAVRLKQVLLNLLSNAIKFTRKGGRVVLNVARHENGDLQIRCRDNGIGMSPEEVAVALKPFGQVDGAYARDHQGTGLGLPLAKSLVELHDGSLTVESTKGTGTTVVVTLPKGRLREKGDGLSSLPIGGGPPPTQAKGSLPVG